MAPSLFSHVFKIVCSRPRFSVVGGVFGELADGVGVEVEKCKAQQGFLVILADTFARKRGFFFTAAINFWRSDQCSNLILDWILDYKTSCIHFIKKK